MLEFSSGFWGRPTIIKTTIDEEIFEQFVREVVRDLNRRSFIAALIKRCLIVAGAVIIVFATLVIPG